MSVISLELPPAVELGLRREASFEGIDVTDLVMRRILLALRIWVWTDGEITEDEKRGMHQNILDRPDLAWDDEE